MADAYSNQLQCLQQQMFVLLVTALQLSTKLFTICMQRQNTLRNIIGMFPTKIVLEIFTISPLTSSFWRGLSVLKSLPLNSIVVLYCAIHFSRSSTSSSAHLIYLHCQRYFYLYFQPSGLFSAMCFRAFMSLRTRQPVLVPVQAII